METTQFSITNRLTELREPWNSRAFNIIFLKRFKNISASTKTKKFVFM